MAKQSRTDELFEMLRARGLRKQVARALSDAAGAGRTGAASSQKAAMSIVADLRKLADEIEDRIRGTSATRSEAAKKGARTRARKATARSTAAKKAAATRKRTTSASPTKRVASTAKRAASTAKRAASPASGGTSRSTRSTRSTRSSGTTGRRSSAKKKT